MGYVVAGIARALFIARADHGAGRGVRADACRSTGASTCSRSCSSRCCSRRSASSAGCSRRSSTTSRCSRRFSSRRWCSSAASSPRPSFCRRSRAHLDVQPDVLHDQCVPLLVHPARRRPVASCRTPVLALVRSGLSERRLGVGGGTSSRGALVAHSVRTCYLGLALAILASRPQVPRATTSAAPPRAIQD